MKNIFLTIEMLFLRLAGSAFVIKIENGYASKVLGKVRNSFIKDCCEIAKANKLKLVLIYATNDSYGNITIKASGDSDKYVLQQLRNTWSFGK